MSTNGTVSQSEWVRQALHEFEGPLVRYAQRITGELESARDVVQDTFLKLCREDRETLEGHLGQWLFTVCRNRALDVHRKERRMSTATDIEQQTPPSTTDPYDAAETHDSATRAIEFLDRLPPNQQEVIRLKFQNELSYREISDVTGLSVSNVGFLRHVGLKRMREMMKVENS